MRIQRSTLVLFGVYATLFSVLLFAAQIVYSPGSIAAKREMEKIDSHDLDVEMTSQWLSKREQVVQRLESAPEKPPYEIVLRTTHGHAKLLKELIESTISSVFFEPKVTPLSVEIVDDREEPRGQVSSDRVSLVASIPSESEFLKVFVHELWHIVDLHYLKNGVFRDDPSNGFYAISWLDYQKKKKGMSIDDFVSGYALSNKYEDFAESFSFYVFHNDEFKRRAAKNASLAAKYDFLANKVFGSGEFLGTSFESQALPTYLWDSTKLPIKTNKYLFYLR